MSSLQTPFVAAGLVLGLLFAGSAPATPLSARERAALAASGRVGASLLEVLSSSDEAEVVVTFADERGWLGGGGSSGPRRVRRIVAATDRVLGNLERGDFELRHRYRHARGMAGRVSARGLARLLAQPDVARVDLELSGGGQLDEARPLVGGDLVAAAGYSGLGVTVAVVDSGTDFTHPDLADARAGEQCFCSTGGGCCPAGGTTQSGTGSAVDDHDHGTNVSGIVAGDGVFAPRGMAPDATIVSVKVLDASNSFCCLSDVVAALDWIASTRPDVDVVNLSLGTNFLYPGVCDAAPGLGPLADAIDALHTFGIVVVAASGNAGSGSQMSAPACIGNAIAVGAVYDSAFGLFDGLGCSEGSAADKPTCFGNSNAETDLMAPGAFLSATRRGGGALAFAGTSQASPIVAGCAALLLQAAPALGPDGVRNAVAGTSAIAVSDPKNGLSFPRLDCDSALSAVPEPAATAQLAAGLGALAALSALRTRRAAQNS